MAIAKIAELQCGVVSREQLLAVGLSQAMIHSRIERYRLHRVHRGVYRVGHTAPLPLARETAALLACGRFAVLSHRSAGHVYGLADPERHDVDVTVFNGGRRRRGGIRVHRSPLSPEDIKVHHRLPVTSPERTIIDLAARRADTWVEWAIADARRRGLITRNSLVQALARAGHRTGTATVRTVLRTEGGPAFTRSEAEARLARLLRRAGLAAAEQNVRVAGHEVDFLWREHGLVVEVDGYAFHKGRAAFERDRRRDAELMAAGYRVLRVTWRQLVEEREGVVALVASGLLPLPGPVAGRGLAALPL